MTKKKKIIVGVGGGCLTLLVIALALLGYLASREWPGGMRPSYPAADYDPRLTREAAKALPIIRAIDRYREEHASLPAKMTDLRPYLPKLPKPPTAAGPLGDVEWPGLYYDRGQNGSSYTLYVKLGWDPTLQYRFDGLQGLWYFDPGDGSEGKLIKLNPSAPSPAS